ncbi:uncharacterized protein Z520_01371 [Fonsecaea multimorphosa CBS 102226]|uniref:Aminoglycoside phosphotransferase domain-containing protein n=1 Tax=Fonsecaea multimorphosa CBS 102226 TaxID=1442371 RepID=A0A0D2HM39_9EURO|nr:uncharacterized protein Z520_01371 [Fonsecaea multimorphosa CBS 102226]KIY02906.1 hypothetical protein Z520_01371 [Fonsecaea multimorphosa CBS 102226]OAL30741.1 hypothetical protein AYO22_01361 [Fonsecaea multimorphosa]
MRQPIDQASLEGYLERHVPEIKVPITIRQFEYGQSNPTYQLTDIHGRHFVLRKKPPGKLLTTAAHQVEREYRVISALNKGATNIPVPKTYCLCEDSDVIGTPFYIMEFLDGRIFQEAYIPGVSAEERRLMWKAAVQTLARLHAVDPISIGLTNFGKPVGFYARQIRTLKRLDEGYSKVVDVASKEAVGRIPGMDEMVAFFEDERYAPQDRGAITHGDYKIDNLVWHKTKPVIIGILDWEIATVGHPLSDLSNLTMPWTVTQNFPEIKTHSHPAFAVDGGPPGLPTKEQCLEWYSEVARWDPRREIVWADAFAIFRTSVMIQGIAARYAVRQASGEGESAAALALQRFPYARAALRMVRELSNGAGSERGDEKAVAVGSSRL